MIRWLYKGIIFFSLIGIISVFFERECYFAAICCLSIITYMSYRLFNVIFEFNFWGDIINNTYNNGYYIGNDNYEYLNYTPNNHIIVYGDKTNDLDVKDITNNIKLRTDKIEIVETSVKEVNRPIVNTDDNFIKENKRVVKKTLKKENIIEDNASINPNEFNKNLIMLVNDDKLSKDVISVYDCIIKALKDCKYPSSTICTLLQSFPYIDLCGKNAIIYVNKRQVEGVFLSKVKRHIIANINEKFNNDIKTVFEDMKYLSVFDYFAKMNAV